jgi:hypothetical protein
VPREAGTSARWRALCPVALLQEWEWDGVYINGQDASWEKGFPPIYDLPRASAILVYF